MHTRQHEWVQQELSTPESLPGAAWSPLYLYVRVLSRTAPPHALHGDPVHKLAGELWREVVPAVVIMGAPGSVSLPEAPP